MGGTETCRGTAQSTSCCRNTCTNCSISQAAQSLAEAGRASVTRVCRAGYFVKCPTSYSLGCIFPDQHFNSFHNVRMNVAQSQKQRFLPLAKCIITEEPENIFLNNVVPLPAVTATLYNTQPHQNSCYLQNCVAFCTALFNGNCPSALSSETPEDKKRLTEAAGQD